MLLYRRASWSRSSRWWAHLLRRSRANFVTHTTIILCVIFIFLWSAFSFFFFAVSHGAFVAQHALQLQNIDPIQNHRQLTGTQIHRSCALLDSRQFENPKFQPLVPQFETVPVPH